MSAHHHLRLTAVVLVSACSDGGPSEYPPPPSVLDAGTAPRDAGVELPDLGAPPDARTPRPRFVFDPARDLPLAEAIAPCMDAHLADLDDDGDLDVVVALEGPSNFVLENDGRGRFSPREVPALALRTEDSEDVIAFFANEDPYPDLLFVSEDLGGENELYLSTGPWSYEAGPPLPAAGVTNGLAIGDVDGDGRPDAILGNAGANFVWRGVAGGGFEAAPTSTFPASTSTAQDVELGDIDGDGDLDLVIGNDDGPNRLWRNEGGGMFVDVTADQLPPDRAAITREVDFADIDGDGDLDLFFANVRFSPAADPNNALLINDGTGRFSYAEQDRLPEDDISTLDGDFADLDGDGDLDLVTANSRVSTGLFPGPYRAYENDGRGRFTDATDRWFPGRYEGFGLDVEVGDLDRDGHLDIYLCGRSSSDRVLFGAR